MSNDGSYFNETKHEKFNRRFDTSAKITSKLLLAAIAGLGMNHYSLRKIGKSVSEIIKDDGNKLPLGSLSDSAYYKIKEIVEAGPAAHGNQESYDNFVRKLSEIHSSVAFNEDFAEFMMSSPEMYQSISAMGVLLTSVAAYVSLSFVSSETAGDFVRIMNRGSTPELEHKGLGNILDARVKLSSHPEQKALKGNRKAAKLVFEHNYDIFKRGLKEKSTSLFHLWGRDIPNNINNKEINVDGFLAILKDIDESTSPIAKRIQEDPAFMDEEIQNLLKDPMLSEHLADKTNGFIDFSNAVKESLGDSINEIFPKLGRKSVPYRHFYEDWHGIRLDVMKKAFEAVDIHMIQHTTSDLIFELGKAHRVGDNTKIREAIARICIWEEQLKGVEGFVDRESNRTIKKTWVKAMDALSPYTTDINNSSEKAAKSVLSVINILDEKEKAVNQNNITLVMSTELFGKEQVGVYKSFEGLYAKTMFSTLEKKVYEHLYLNDLKPSALEDLKESDFGAFKNLCVKYGINEASDVIMMADEAAKMKMSKIMSKVMEKVSQDHEVSMAP